MPRLIRTPVSGLVLSVGVLVAVRGLPARPASAEEPRAKPQNAAPAPVDFAHEVVPILQKRCAKCHAGTQRKGGFSINTRQGVIAGGDEGAAVVPRKSAESPLIERVTSEDAGLRMPPEGDRLTREQVELLSRWIDLNLPWEDGFAFGKSLRQAPLPPRRPPVPDGPSVVALKNPIDRFLHGYFEQHTVASGEVAPDAVFARRASFDLIGIGPSPAELEAFLSDARPDKRERFVDRLLDDRMGYAAHWITFWNDLLRNAYHGTGFIDGGRLQITGWLYEALLDNRPYDRFVRELVNPVPGVGAEGFIYGIKWRGTVNESQRREIQAAQSVAQVFLGTNLKCASCHDSFVNHWKLTDAYALASVFAEKPLELHRCDHPIGVQSSVAFLYPQLGAIDGAAPEADRRRQLAELLTHRDNGRLARTIVNRLWAKLFGRGLVEPLDNMDAEPWHQDLLDFLAADLADHGYDLKRTLRLLATSRAYQRPGIGLDHEGRPDNSVFRGPLVKRLSAEQFVDTVYALTETWPICSTSMLRRDGRGQYGQLRDLLATAAKLEPRHPGDERTPLSRARWVWKEGNVEASEKQELHLRRTWKLAERPSHGVATFAANAPFELWVNGKSVANVPDGTVPVQVNISEHLKADENVIALKVTRAVETPNPPGVIGEVFALNERGRRLLILSTDAEWSVSETAADSWLKPDFEAAGWRQATELGEVASPPWNLAQRIASGEISIQDRSELPATFRIRAALTPLDGLQSALGRPNREQVVSSRDAAPTMLQALELTNGVTLGGYLAQGAAKYRSAGGNPGELIDRVYRVALTRAPSEEERRLALETLGATLETETIEDLLWTICMLPEFQLVP